jgi:hypothetical protein
VAHSFWKNQNVDLINYCLYIQMVYNLNRKGLLIIRRVLT